MNYQFIIIWLSNNMLKYIKKILFQTSHLAPYLPFIAENKQKKVMRIIGDKSNINQTFQDNSHFNNHKKPSYFQKIIQGKLSIISPISTTLLIWYAFVFLAILYYYVQIGLVLTYRPYAWQDELSSSIALTFDGLTILIFVIDMFIQLNSGFLTRGMIIMDRTRVLKRYLRYFFGPDVLCVLILIVTPLSGSIDMNYLKLIFMAYKLTRLSMIDDYFLRKFNVYRNRKTIYVIFKLIFIILLLSHILGLVFYAIDFYFYSTGYYSPQFCWVYSATTYSPIISLSWQWQYMYSLYWGINTITTISYGDIAPNNPLQVIYTTFMFCFGFIVYGYVVNQIVKVILWARGHKDKLRSNMVVMDIYMNNLKVSHQIKQQVRDYIQFLHAQEKNRNLELEQQMKEKLPEDLRYQLVKSAYSIMNQKITGIFQTRSSTKLLFHLQQKKYIHDEIVINQGELAMNLYYLHKGQMSFEVKFGSKSEEIYKTHHVNQFLNQYEFFTIKKCSCSIISKAGSTVYSISREHLMEQISKNDKLKQKLEQVEYDIIFKKNLQKIYYSCYFCNENHRWIECPEKFYIGRHKIFTQKELECIDENKRIERRKYHTLGDMDKLEVLYKIRDSTNKKLLGTIEKRLAKIKQKITQRNQELDLDLGFDWKYFQFQENLSKKKQLWNRIVQQKERLRQQKKQKQ